MDMQQSEICGIYKICCRSQSNRRLMWTLSTVYDLPYSRVKREKESKFTHI